MCYFMNVCGRWLFIINMVITITTRKGSNNDNVITYNNPYFSTMLAHTLLLLTLCKNSNVAIFFYSRMLPLCERAHKISLKKRESAQRKFACSERKLTP